jgi:hypothetical protein
MPKLLGAERRFCDRRDFRRKLLAAEPDQIPPAIGQNRRRWREKRGFREDAGGVVWGRENRRRHYAHFAGQALTIAP